MCCYVSSVPSLVLTEAIFYRSLRGIRVPRSIEATATGSSVRRCRFMCPATVTGRRPLRRARMSPSYDGIRRRGEGTRFDAEIRREGGDKSRSRDMGAIGRHSRHVVSAPNRRNTLSAIAPYAPRRERRGPAAAGHPPPARRRVTSRCSRRRPPRRCRSSGWPHRRRGRAPPRRSRRPRPSAPSACRRSRPRTSSDDRRRRR